MNARVERHRQLAARHEAAGLEAEESRRTVRRERLMNVISLPPYKEFAEALKPILRVRILDLYEIRLKQTPSHAVLEHLLEVALQQLKVEVEQAYDLQMSAKIAITTITNAVLAKIKDEVEREASALLPL